MNAPEELNRTVLLCRDYVSDALADEQIIQAFEAHEVLCVADQKNLESHSGQTALVTLVSLLSRMGIPVQLRIPEVSMVRPQPPFSGQYLRESLLQASRLLTSVSPISPDRRTGERIVFVLGDTAPSLADSDARFVRRVIGDCWRGGLTQISGLSHTWTSAWPVGAMAAAALAATEAFKFVLRSLPFRDERDRLYFEQANECAWDFGGLPIPQTVIDAGFVDIISAGAISQALLYSLLRVPGLRMSARLFDDDRTALSNLNRNMLTLLSDIGVPKVLVMSRYCSGDVSLDPHLMRITTDHNRIELAPRVTIGVDDIPSRWEVQRRAPAWVAVAGTSHFNVSSSEHQPDGPCSGCLHHVDDPGPQSVPTVSFVSFFAGLATAVRLLRNLLGFPYAHNKAHLWIAPLLMQNQAAGLWLPIAPHPLCPVSCPASIAIARHAA